MTQSNILMLLTSNNSNAFVEIFHISSSTWSNSIDGSDGVDTLLANQFITILYFGEMFGALISFLFVDHFGRKVTLITSLLFCFLMICWAIFADSFQHLYTSRFLIGVSLGFIMTISPIYIAEVRWSLRLFTLSPCLWLFCSFCSCFVLRYQPRIKEDNVLALFL
jgi:MFS family permease